MSYPCVVTTTGVITNKSRKTRHAGEILNTGTILQTNVNGTNLAEVMLGTSCATHVSAQITGRVSIDLTQGTTEQNFWAYVVNSALVCGVDANMGRSTYFGKFLFFVRTVGGLDPICVGRIFEVVWPIATVVLMRYEEPETLLQQRALGQGQQPNRLPYLIVDNCLRKEDVSRPSVENVGNRNGILLRQRKDPTELSTGGEGLSMGKAPVISDTEAADGLLNAVIAKYDRIDYLITSNATQNDADATAGSLPPATEHGSKVSQNNSFVCLTVVPPGEDVTFIPEKKMWFSDGFPQNAEAGYRFAVIVYDKEKDTLETIKELIKSKFEWERVRLQCGRRINCNENDSKMRIVDSDSTSSKAKKAAMVKKQNEAMDESVTEFVARQVPDELHPWTVGVLAETPQDIKDSFNLAKKGLGAIFGGGSSPSIPHFVASETRQETEIELMYICETKEGKWPAAARHSFDSRLNLAELKHELSTIGLGKASDMSVYQLSNSNHEPTAEELKNPKRFSARHSIGEGRIRDEVTLRFTGCYCVLIKNDKLDGTEFITKYEYPVDFDQGDTEEEKEKKRAGVKIDGPGGAVVFGIPTGVDKSKKSKRGKKQ